MAKAVQIAMDTMKERTKHEIYLRDLLIKQVFARIPYVRLNGDRTRRLPNNVNFSFQFVEGESLLIMLDMAGYARPAVQPVRQGLWILHMSFWQSGFPMRSHTVLYG